MKFHKLEIPSAVLSTLHTSSFSPSSTSILAFHTLHHLRGFFLVASVLRKVDHSLIMDESEIELEGLPSPFSLVPCPFSTPLSSHLSTVERVLSLLSVRYPKISTSPRSPPLLSSSLHRFISLISVSNADSPKSVVKYPAGHPLAPSKSSAGTQPNGETTLDEDDAFDGVGIVLSDGKYSRVSFLAVILTFPCSLSRAS